MFIYKTIPDQTKGNLIDDLRPISITSCFFKLIERLLLNRIKILIQNN